MTALIDGPVGSRLLRFVLPILAGNILQQLYNSIDAMIIGRFVGENALGAIGVSQPIINVVLALVIGLGIGEEILLGQYIGRRDKIGVKQVFDTLKKLSETKLVIVVSHDREFAEQYADRIIELSDGHVISDVELDSEAEHAETPVSYTHLDVYKRQLFYNDKIENVNNSSCSDIYFSIDSYSVVS